MYLRRTRTKRDRDPAEFVAKKRQRIADDIHDIEDQISEDLKNLDPGYLIEHEESSEDAVRSNETHSKNILHDIEDIWETSKEHHHSTKQYNRRFDHELDINTDTMGKSNQKSTKKGAAKSRKGSKDDSTDNTRKRSGNSNINFANRVKRIAADLGDPKLHTVSTGITSLGETVEHTMNIWGNIPKATTLTTPGDTATRTGNKIWVKGVKFEIHINEKTNQDFVVRFLLGRCCNLENRDLEIYRIPQTNNVTRLVGLGNTDHVAFANVHSGYWKTYKDFKVAMSGHLSGSAGRSPNKILSFWWPVDKEVNYNEPGYTLDRTDFTDHPIYGPTVDKAKVLANWAPLFKFHLQSMALTDTDMLDQADIRVRSMVYFRDL